MAEPATGSRLRVRLSSVRLRTALAVTVIAAVAAVAGAWLLVAALGSQLAEGIVVSAETRADEVAQRLEDGTPVDELELVDEDDRFVQVVDADGAVAAASPGSPTEPLTVPKDGDTVTDVHARVPSEDDTERYAVTAESVSTPAGSLTVLVTQEASEIDDSQQALIGTLEKALPLVVLAVGLATWLLVGRALAPVEAIRAEVQRITADRLDQRVPEPSSRDEVAELARTMNAMLERLEQAQHRQRRLVSDASHELRSPATAIRQHAELALAHPASTSAEELARVTLTEGQRLEQLVEQMLWLARTDETTSALRQRTIDLDDLVLEEASRVRATSSTRVSTALVSGGQVRGDPMMLRRVAANLLDNAVGHARDEVRVALFEDGDDVVLRVDDDGPGIALADRDRVLERFVRLDEARSRQRGGAGLGLAIVRGVVEAHGGTVLVGESDLGGARFDVVLPAHLAVQAPVRKTSLTWTPTTDEDPGGTS